MSTMTLKPSLQEAAERRRINRMEAIDRLPVDWRELVHDYGYNAANALRCCGVTQVRHARHIIETVLDELSPTRGTLSCQGAQTRFENQLVLVPREPTEAMIDASMATVSNFDIAVSKREKHKLRLKAALLAATGARKRA